jgi:hypothetical protein
VADGAELVGARALSRDLGRFAGRAGQLERAMREGNRRAVAVVAVAARGSVPSVTGTLAASAGDWADDDDPTGWQAGYDGVDYAGPVDMGGWPSTRAYSAGGRYMFPAASGVDTAAASLDADRIDAALGSFGWTNDTDNPEAVHD